jgi:proteic killer suppression protein
MIQSFTDYETEAVFNGRQTKAALKTFPADLWKTAQRKFDQIDSVIMPEELRIPPGNHIEALVGDRAGQHSIRINRQYRICFLRTPSGPANVEIMDYH